MYLREWLPKTDRNRVALAFALFSLVIFAIWNGIPVKDYRSGSIRGFGMVFWPEVLSYEIYVVIFKTREVANFMALAAIIASFISSMMTLLTIPFWKFFHASRILRIPIATASLIGGKRLIFRPLS